MTDTLHICAGQLTGGARLRVCHGPRPFLGGVRPNSGLLWESEC